MEYADAANRAVGGLKGLLRWRQPKYVPIIPRHNMLCGIGEKIPRPLKRFLCCSFSSGDWVKTSPYRSILVSLGLLARGRTKRIL